MTLAGWSHLAVAVAYLLTAGLVLWRASRAAGSLYLALAAMVTAAWGATVALHDHQGGALFADAMRVAEAVRACAWIGLLISIASNFVGRTPTPWRYLGIAAVGITIAQVAMTLAMPAEEMAGLGYLLGIALAIAGLMTIENVLRNLSQSQLWAVKYLMVALLTLFISDFVVHSVVFLFRQDDAAFVTARGMITVALIPLILVSAIRNPIIAVNIHASRGVVFHSATLIASGAYLIVTALVGSYVRSIGGQAATSLSLVVVTLALIGLVLALLSTTVRSAIKLFINENFFSYRYDYRLEWSRLIRTIASDDEVVGLHARAIKAAAELMDSPAGSLWLRDSDSGALALAHAWHVRPAAATIQPGDPLLAALDAKPAIVNLQDPQTFDEAMLAVPDSPWRAAMTDLWLVVPLVHRDRLIGALLMARPRVPRLLGDEDYQFIRLIAAQIAGYIAEELSYRALNEARQLEEFNKRFVFVIHDIKNLTGQLSLLVRNLEKFGDQPAFRADLSTTLRNSVDKMKGLLEQLSAKRAGGSESAATAPQQQADLVPLVRGFTEQWRAGDRSLAFNSPKTSVLVNLGNPENLTNVLEQLVQNALEATPPEGTVQVAVSERGGRGVIEVTDQGPGMEPEFVRNELFRPFRTTKGAGFGIGAYQAREVVRQLGGALEVDTAPGRGTTMRIALPLAAAPLAARV